MSILKRGERERTLMSHIYKILKRLKKKDFGIKKKNKKNKKKQKKLLSFLNFRNNFAEFQLFLGFLFLGQFCLFGYSNSII